ncbi:hypothetical protein [Streptomyces albipurpureus]|uniref:Uncharacterized protein n=1 Tax=Streptomyces albipurpureus TaxID=2897419 RepID=A0ABT0UZ32_9ACTN|nr:hypothetical protein [Streptomyces sp. CWNU-1]MCM2392573.1 hypothetical protein [Streptomyces sp. CWNU-1]
MGEPEAGKTFSTYLDGDQIVLPATINGIRKALPPHLRRQFDAEVGETAAEELFVVLAGWAERTRPDLIAAKDAIFRRLAQGDHSGLISEEEVNDFFGPDETSAE